MPSGGSGARGFAGLVELERLAPALAIGTVVLLDASEAGVLFGTADDRSTSAGAPLLPFSCSHLARPPGDT